MTDEQDFTIAFQGLYPRALRLVTTNLAIDTLRGREHASELTDGRVDATVDHQDALTLRVALVAALRALPTRQRGAVALRYLAGLSQADVAATLGISTGSVAQHVHRGLRVLRGQFTEPLLEEPMKISSRREAASLAGTDRLVSAHVLGVWKIGWNVDIGIPAVLIARGQSRGQTADQERLVGQTLEVNVSEVDEVRDRVMVTLPVAADEDFERRRDLISAACTASSTPPTSSHRSRWARRSRSRCSRPSPTSSASPSHSVRHPAFRRPGPSIVTFWQLESA